MSSEATDPERRCGDSIEIGGDYQYKAITSGNAVQRFWHETKKDVIRALLPPSAGDFVLDVGSGSGVIAGYLGELGATVTGVDGNPRAVEFARSRFACPNVQFHLGLVDEAFSLPRQADKIYCLEVIEHLYWPQVQGMLQHFRAMLSEDGRLLLTTPNYFSFWPLIEWTMDTFHLAPEMSGKQHVTRFTPRSLSRLAEETGFKVDTLRTVSFLAPWLAPVSWKLAESVHRLEMRCPVHVGSIIAVVLSKRHA